MATVSPYRLRARLFARPLLPSCVFWCAARVADPAGYALARRHYSAKKNRRPKQRQFVGSGEKLVLMSPWDDALFVWRKFIDDSGQQGVNCAIFRNEGYEQSSAMIREADALAWERWPGERHYTYVDGREVQSSNPGYCFLKAGWNKCGVTSKGLLILERVWLQP